MLIEKFAFFFKIRDEVIIMKQEWNYRSFLVI